MKDRQLIIINLLMNEKSISIDELSHSLKVSSRTIRNDLKDINSKFIELSISRVDNRRGNLSLSLTSTEKRLLSKYLKSKESIFFTPEERKLNIIFSFLYHPKRIKIYEEQKKLEISKSTMDKDMRQIRSYLNEFSLNLSTQQGAEIIGAEKNIRTMIYQLIVENVNISQLVETVAFKESNNYQIIVNFLEMDILSEAKETARALIAGGKYDGVSAREAEITILLAIWANRLRQHQYIDEKQINDIEENEINDLLQKFVNQLHILMPINEEAYMYFILKNFLGESKETIATWSQSQLLTLKMIDFMSNRENIDYKNSEKLYEQLNSHITNFLQRQKNHISIHNPLTSVLKNSYSNIFEDVSKFFETSYPYHVSDGEKAYITVYFSTYYEQIVKQNDFYKIAVLCNYGEATGQLLAANISKNMNLEIVAILGLQDISSLKKLNIDFVVKTIDAPVNVPSLKMPPVPSAEDYQRLRNFSQQLNIKHHVLPVKVAQKQKNNLLKEVINAIEKDMCQKVTGSFVDDLIHIFSAHDIDINESEVRPMIQDLITDEKIQVHIKADNWKEAIEKAAKPLLDNGSINESYVTAMEESVKKYGAYIVIGPGIALAHARPEDGVSKLDVSISTLKTPINFGSKENDPVKVIFVLSAIDNYSHLNILKGIINLINHPHKIDDLYEANDVETLRNCLFEEVKN